MIPQGPLSGDRGNRRHLNQDPMERGDTLKRPAFINQEADRRLAIVLESIMEVFIAPKAGDHPFLPSPLPLTCPFCTPPVQAVLSCSPSGRGIPCQTVLPAEDGKGQLDSFEERPRLFRRERVLIFTNF